MQMYEIAITNEQFSLPIDDDWFRGAVVKLLESELVEEAVISVAFLSDVQIHAFNRQFLDPRLCDRRSQLSFK